MGCDAALVSDMMIPVLSGDGRGTVNRVRPDTAQSAQFHATGYSLYRQGGPSGEQEEGAMGREKQEMRNSDRIYPIAFSPLSPDGDESTVAYAGAAVRVL